MTIQGWVFFGILALFILSFGIFGAIIFEKIVWKVLSVVAATLLIIGLFAGMRWYYQNTASGQRAMTDQKSELDNGLERTVGHGRGNGLHRPDGGNPKTILLEKGKILAGAV